MTSRARLVSFFALCVFVALQIPSADAQAGKKPKLETLLNVQVSVQPDDPFDPRIEAKAAEKFKARRGEVVRVELHAKLTDGWNTYPATQRTNQQDEVQLTTYTVEKVPGITPLWPLRESEPKVGKLKDKSGEQAYFKFEKGFTWSQDFLVAADAPMGVLQVPIKVNLQICKGTCIWYDHVIPVSIEVSDEAPMPMTPEITKRIELARPKISVVPFGPEPAPPVKDAPKGKVEAGGVPSEALIRDTHEEYKAKMDAIAKQVDVQAVGDKAQGTADLLGFILAGIFWGAISLITPCVFPMIPITVSFFLKQSEKEHHRPIVMASVYSLTIVIVLTLAAAFLLSVFRWLSINPLTNYFLGGLFIFFALSLFGMYEIELPQSLAQYTSAREGQGGLVGTIFMALTFTIISFACVAPFLGGFGGTSADDRPFFHNLLGGLAFSVTFASPFFFLALFPALLRKMPKSGSWLNSVKVVMGFLELAAAFKFFRTAELIQTDSKTTLFTFDFILAIWIGMCILCALYLIGTFRLPHDTPEEHISVPRLLFAAVFVGLAFYLVPAMFKNPDGQPQRPKGGVYSWIESFLLPDAQADEGTANLEYAIAKAREETKRTGQPKRIFIDFTGVTCTNCKINEQSVFTKPEISRLLSNYLMVKIYTDTVPTEYYAPSARTDSARFGRDAKLVNLPFQKKLFDTEQLPLYVILEPLLNDHIRIVGVYDEGRINNEAAFAEFLNPEKK